MYTYVIGAVVAVVVSVCVAAMLDATPTKPSVEYLLKFRQEARLHPAPKSVVGGTYNCYEGAGVEQCLLSAGADVCAPGEQFEIMNNGPLEYDKHGDPVVKYRCFIVIEKPPI